MISLVIVNYNQERYLAKAIASVIAQTRKDWELLIWDDGSTDNSLTIAREYEQQDERIRVIVAPHQGIAKARKKAIAETRGDYIGWVDSDDWLADNALAETALVLEGNSAIGMVYTDYYDVNSRGTVKGIGKRCNIPYSSYRLLVDFMTFHFRLLRREVYEQIGGINPDFEYVYDYDLCLRLSEITQVAKVVQPLYYYRQHSKSRSAKYQLQRITWSKKAINRALQRRGLANTYSLQVKGDRFKLQRISTRLIKGESRGDRSSTLLAKVATLIAAIPFTTAIAINPANAQQIVPNNDGTMTVITEDGNTFNIDGGTLSGDGKNLFHSFQEFGLDAGQIANFLSNPNIQNILGRINGGNPSLINGLIQVTGGNSNLFLMNPSGIIFGNNASLNVPGDFTATTATGIGFGNNWFNAVGANDYLNLSGNPDSFNFANAESGVIINAGDLKVAKDSKISLTGGTVINTGTIETEGGNITVAAVPGTNRVRISQEGQLLSLEVAIPQDDNGEALPIRVTDLPNLLRGLPVEIDTGLEVAANDDVTVTDSNTVIPNEAGTTIVSGTIDGSNTQAETLGGEVNILGDKVGLIGAEVDVSGDAGGGKVLVGGEYQGQGTVPKAEVTFVDRDSTIKADALQNGDGGEIIIWADNTTQFDGNILARGGSANGDGGFVEVSGKNNLIFDGTVDVSAAQGNVGTLLLDPIDITIVDGDGYGGDGIESADDSEIISDNQILAGDGDLDGDGTPDVSFTISENALENLAGDATVILEATNNITIEDLSDDDLSFASGSGNSITFDAGSTFSMNAGDAIIAPGRNIIINAETVNAGFISSASDLGQGGDINITAENDINTGSVVSGSLNSNGGNITIQSEQGSINTTAASRFSLTESNEFPVESGVVASASANGNGGTIELNAANNITTGTVFSSSLATGNGGNITVTSSNNGNIDTTQTTAINIPAIPTILDNPITINGLDATTASTGADATGGEITITTSGNITPQDITTTNNDINLNGAVNLTEATTVTVNGTTPGNINFASTVNGANDLTLNAGSGAINVAGAIGDTVPIGNISANSIGTTNFGGSVNATSLTTDANGTTVLNGNVTTNFQDFSSDGSQTYNDAVELAQDVELVGTGYGDITFNSTVRSQGEPSSLTITTINFEEFSFTPDIVFNGAVGDNEQPLSNLETNTDTGTTIINGGSITTTESQTYNTSIRVDNSETTTDLIADSDSNDSGAVTAQTIIGNGQGFSIQGTSITTANISNTFSVTPGDITLNSTNGNITTGSIEGGNILVDSNGVDDNTTGLFTATATIPETNTSISGTNVIIEHGGGNTESGIGFDVGGNPETTNGTVGNIVTTTESIDPFPQSFDESFISPGETIQILTTTGIPIVAANDGTGSVVTAQTGDDVVYDITGGTLSGDEANLFHSFTRFDLPQSEQTANFVVANEALNNILARVSSGDASDIQGTIQVSGGTPNLFLINPAGVIFGSNAQIDVPAAFTVTTGNGVSFGDNWFSASGAFDAAVLNGTPEAIALTSNNPGTIVNNASLTNDSGALTFVGGTVVNSGNVSSNGFNAIALNEGASIVNLSDLTISSTEDAASLPNEFEFDVETFSDLVSLINLDEDTNENIIVNAENPDDTALEIQNPVNSNGQDINLVGNSNNAQGVRIDTTVNANGGNINITGTSVAEDGVFIRGALTTSGDGATNVTGTSTEAVGILTLGVDDDPIEGIEAVDTQITTANGAINFIGTSTNSLGIATQNTDISSNNTTVDTGAIAITGTSTNQTAIQLESTDISTTINVDSPDTNITLTADTMELGADADGNLNSFTSNELVLQPETPSRNINLQTDPDNSPADALNFADGEIEQLSENVNSIAIGREDGSGTITVIDNFDDDNDLTVESNLTLRTPQANGAIVTNDVVEASETITENEIETPNPNQDVTLNAGTNIDINQDIITNGGNITITSGDTIDSSTVDLDSSSFDFPGGDISITANNNISLGGIITDSASDSPEDKAGDVTVTSNNGAIFAPPDSSIQTLFDNEKTIGIVASAGNGNGGNVTFTAAGDIQIFGIDSSSTNGDGGDIFITSTNGAINATSPISPTEGATVSFGLLLSGTTGQDGGDITLQAAENITTGFIYSGSLGTGTGGVISLNSTNGNIDTTIGANPQPIDAEIVEVPEDLELIRDTIFAGVSSRSVNNAGNINLTANNGNVTTSNISAESNTNADTATGGEVTMTASENITLQDVITTNNNLTFTGNEIDIPTDNDIAGNTVTLQPQDPTLNIAIATEAPSDNTLDLTQIELNTINADSIAIGNAIDGSGIITVTNPVTVEDPTSLATPLGTIQVNGAITGTDNASITLNSSQSNLNSNITTEGDPISVNSPITLENDVELNTTQQNNSDGADITITGDINGANNQLILDVGSSDINLEDNSDNTTSLTLGSLDATGTISTSGKNLEIITTETITTGDINTTAENSPGGTVNLNSTQGTITTEDIDTSGTTGGSVTLESGDNQKIEVGSIRANSTVGNNGGEIKINANNEKPGLFVANDFINDEELGAFSIFTNSSNSETITIKHGGNGKIPFRVADPNLLERDNPNGTVSAILGGNNQINDGSFLFTEREGNIEIISVDSPDEDITKEFDAESPPPIEVETATNSTFPSTNLSVPSISEARKVLRKIEQQAAQKPALVYVGFSSPEIAATTNNPEEYFTRAENCLTAEYKEVLTLEDAQTDPTICLAAQPEDKLEILVITPEEEPIYVRVDVTRAEVEQEAEDLYLDISDNQPGYKGSADKLYGWLISSIEEQLETRNINNLLFILPQRLRSLPLAALYDGATEQYLVEKGYNVGLAPSINLMNTTYKDIQQARVLALGASEFTEDQNQNPLYAVEVELPQIVSLRGGQEPIINEQFTINNLQSSLKDDNSLIVHLSTHADFSTASVEDIYIQLYNQKLTLEELESLDLKVGASDLELLVLSACRTAFDEPETAEAELGFAGLAVKLGVKTAIGSLWYVEDITNPGLMLEFYHQLKTSPSKAEALRLAQLAMINREIKIDLQNRQMITSWGEVIDLPENVVADLQEKGITNINLRHPYYWAPFTIIGSPW